VQGAHHALVRAAQADTDAQRQELLTVAGKCPVHKLMTQATTEVITELASLSGEQK
jgi:uncharacterized OsmC-like protein